MKWLTLLIKVRLVLLSSCVNIWTDFHTHLSLLLCDVSQKLCIFIKFLLLMSSSVAIKSWDSFFEKVDVFSEMGHVKVLQWNKLIRWSQSCAFEHNFMLPYTLNWACWLLAARTFVFIRSFETHFAEIINRHLTFLLTFLRNKHIKSSVHSSCKWYY